MSSTNQTVEAPRDASASSLEAAAARSGSRLRRAFVVAALLVVVGIVAGLLPRLHQRAALKADTADLALQTVAVIAPAPGKAAVNLPLPAEVKPYLEAPIYARASGYLKRWTHDIGAQVKEGDLLAEIDTPELNQELAHARAQLSQAQAALALAKTTAARWTDLLKTASVSEQEATEKQADFELKTANVEAAQAEVRRLEDLQSFQSVRAPFSGIITARNTDVGQLITAGNGRELFRLAQTGTLRVYVRVPQTLAPSVAPGQTAEMTIPEMPGRVIDAKVVRTAGAVSADSRTLLTELEVGNTKGDILSGAYAQVRFNHARPQAALTVPANALLFRAEGPQVGIAGPGGKVTLRNVTLGRDFGSTMEIIDGLTTADQVILNPPDSLVSGMLVRVASAPGGTTEGK